MKIKLSAFAIAVLIAGGVFISCSVPESTEQVPIATTADETAAETKVLRSADLLPAADLEGADYTILGREYAKLGVLPQIEFAVEELNGDLINDTIYTRNMTVEQNYNVRIRAMTGSAGTLVKTSVMAGDGAYDLVWAHVNDMASLTVSDMLANYYDIPYIDLTQKWWNGLATESLTLNGKCYLEMNYIPFTGVMLSHSLFFNIDMLEQYQLTSPYELVNRNSWTFDEFAALSRSVYQDINGDGQRDSGDVYGLLASHGTAGGAFSIGMGVRAVDVSDDGTVSLILASDRNQSILEKIIDLTTDESTWLITDYAKENDLAKMFTGGQGLFYSGFLTDAYQFFRSMEDDYGLLVFPKYAESDDRYITTVTGGTGLLGIPRVVADAERTGLITEALAIESYLDVYPAVFETVVNYKLLRDEDSQNMFALLMDGMEINFARTYKNSYSDIFPDLTAAASRDLASTCAKQSSAAEEHYKKVVDYFFGE